MEELSWWLAAYLEFKVKVKIAQKEMEGSKCKGSVNHDTGTEVSCYFFPTWLHSFDCDEI